MIPLISAAAVTVGLWICYAVFLHRAHDAAQASLAAKCCIVAAILGTAAFCADTAVFYTNLSKIVDKASADTASADFLLFIKIDLGIIAAAIVLLLIFAAASPRMQVMRSAAACLWSLIVLMLTYAAAAVTSGGNVASYCITAAGISSVFMLFFAAAADAAVLKR